MWEAGGHSHCHRLEFLWFIEMDPLGEVEEMSRLHTWKAYITNQKEIAIEDELNLHPSTMLKNKSLKSLWAVGRMKCDS